MSDATRTGLVVLGVVVVVFPLLPLFWGGAMMGGVVGPWMMGGWSGGLGWTGGVGVIFMVLFWTLLIGGAVLLVKSITDGGTSSIGRPRSEESVLEILKRRYASGEITKDQFEQMRRDLE